MEGGTAAVAVSSQEHSGRASEMGSRWAKEHDVVVCGCVAHTAQPHELNGFLKGAIGKKQHGKGATAPPAIQPAY